MSTNGAELDPQLQNWTFQPSFELSPPLSVEQISPLFIPSLQVISADQTAPTFNDIDQIVAHSRRWINGYRVMNILCIMADGERRWISTSHLRRDSRVSDLVDRYYRDLKYPYWVKRSTKKRKL